MSANLEVTEKFVWGEAKRGDALGSHQVWGWSPAQDLLEPMPASALDGGEGPIRILMASPGDPRSILRTLARRRRGAGAAAKLARPIEIYVHEESVELLARHLLLLRVAQDWELPLRQRAAVWMELYGNAHVQERTENYVSRLAGELVGVVGSGGAASADADAGIGELVDLAKLRFRERDLLTDAFGAWRKEAPALPMADLWDRRLRRVLGARYDSKDATFDWDYRQGLTPASPGANLIHLKTYRRWRSSGVAFEFGDQVYDKANRSLATYVDGFLKAGKDRGCKRECRGYWGDMVVGPWVGMGTEVLDPEAPHVDDLLLTTDKGHATEQRRHNAAEVFYYNLLATLFAIETGEDYAMTRAHDIFSGLAAGYGAGGRDALARAEAIVETLDGVTIHPLTGDLNAALAKHFSTEGKKFDAAYLSANAAPPALGDGAKPLAAALKARAVVHVETAQFLVPLKKDEKELFASKIHDWCAAADLKPLYDHDANVPRDKGAVRLEYEAP